MSMDSTKHENGLQNGLQENANDAASNSNDEDEINDSTMSSFVNNKNVNISNSSGKVLGNASNTSLNSSSAGKKRGRPRLYSVNPVTGKPIKNRPINPNTPVSVKSETASTPFTNEAINMAPHLANGMAIYPSPSTSTSSYLSSSNANSNNMFHFNGLSGNLIQTNPMTTSTPAPFPLLNDEQKAQNDEEMQDENEQTQQEEMDNEQCSSVENNKNIDEKENENRMNCSSVNNNSKNDSKNESLNKSQSLVLTHYIDGYVIKESSKPFPVKSSKKKTSSPSTSHKSPSKFVCVQCGSKKKSISNDKFCSVSCIKRHNKASKSSSSKSKHKSHEKDKPIDDEEQDQETQEDDDDDTGVRNLRSNKDRLKNIPDQYKSNENNTSSSSTSKHKRHKHHHKSKSKHSKSSKGDHEQQPQQQMDVTQTTPCNSTMLPHNNNHNPHFSPLNTSSIQNHLNMNSSPVTNSFNYNNSMQEQYPSGDPTNWNCDEVYQFVNCVAGLQIAEMFKSQEVDGSALTLIRDDHLVNTMQIKLGPALKIMSKFNELKSKYYQPNRQQV